MRFTIWTHTETFYIYMYIIFPQLFYLFALFLSGVEVGVAVGEYNRKLLSTSKSEGFGKNGI